MVTIDFIKLAMDVAISDREFCLADGSGSNIIVRSSEYGKKTLEWTRTEDDTSVTVKTTGDPVYFDEYIYAFKVDRLAAVSGTTPYYSLPLQHEVTIQPGYQIKINPYKEDASGNHTRGIMVKFSIPEV